MKIRTRLIFLIIVLLMPMGAGPPSGAARAQESQEEKLQEFIPSEELPADSEISFPVDI